MCSETTSLLPVLLVVAALLAILFRLSNTFTLIANTQRELRRAIYRLAECRRTELNSDDAFAEPGIAFVSRPTHARVGAESMINLDDVLSPTAARRVV
jgi:hypothetical protein